MDSSDYAVIVDYTNYRGERRKRRVEPISLHFELNKYHEGAQWFLRVRDLERPATPERMLALKDIHSWKPAVERTRA